MADWGQFPDGPVLNSGGKWTQKSKGKNRVHLIDEITHEIHNSYQGFCIHAFYLSFITHPFLQDLRSGTYF